MAAVISALSPGFEADQYVVLIDAAVSDEVTRLVAAMALTRD